MKVIRRRDEDYPPGARPRFLQPVRFDEKGNVIPAGDWVEVVWICEGDDDDGDE